MKRKIKFRGKRIDNGEWAYGNFVRYPSCKGEWVKLSEIWDFDREGDHYWVVVPETVAQFTGLKDKNGVEIYEGDTLIFPYVDSMGKLHNEEDFRKTVVFKYGCFGYETETKFIPLMEWMKTERGEYISNCGNKVVYTEKYPFWVQR